MGGKGVNIALKSSIKNIVILMEIQGRGGGRGERLGERRGEVIGSNLGTQDRRKERRRWEGTVRGGLGCSNDIDGNTGDRRRVRVTGRGVDDGVLGYIRMYTVYYDVCCVLYLVGKEFTKRVTIKMMYYDVSCVLGCILPCRERVRTFRRGPWWYGSDWPSGGENSGYRRRHLSRSKGLVGLGWVGGRSRGCVSFRSKTKREY